MARFVNRGGQRKGSHYSLNSQGLAMAKEMTAKLIGRENRRQSRVVAVADISDHRCGDYPKS
jgi:hypothetical protein